MDGWMDGLTTGNWKDYHKRMMTSPTSILVPPLIWMPFFICSWLIVCWPSIQKFLTIPAGIIPHGFIQTFKSATLHWNKNKTTTTTTTTTTKKEPQATAFNGFGIFSIHFLSYIRRHTSGDATSAPAPPPPPSPNWCSKRCQFETNRHEKLNR